MVQLRSHLATTLNQWLGASGGGTPIDILKFDGTTAIIRVPFDDHRGVWQALTVATFKMAGTGEARFQVLRNSAFAMGVAASSRATYKTV
ncbi:hypothetical protein DL89DRAFT_267761 [Linderina pennispora]|uniref:Ribonucleases P/MRP subunit Pop8-like domain-containing protein n=1 Tax=Linderina pennispora TaxID=61395 RepID=A0A1Y1W7T2_9FUNG|nr:uncharacterized protein DL89DRAFT_267761 [Linderina pennispora]ORX69577.1 hypothetical protein DL89DRAFT_267761 [Linderina pennispora]